MTTHVLETAEVDIAYDVHGPLHTVDGRPPLFMIGQPMDASGFGSLALHIPDRTVVTNDPRGLGRSTRKDGRVDNAPTVQADDVHTVIEAAERARAGVRDAYQARGSSAGMAAFIAMTSWQGEFTDDFVLGPAEATRAIGARGDPRSRTPTGQPAAHVRTPPERHAISS